MARAAALLLLLACGACATVQPWEKEVLGQRRMAFSHESADRHFVDHAIVVQEQADGSSGGEGGGCGCR